MARIAEVSRALAEQEAATTARPQGNMLAELSGMRDFDGQPKVVPASKGAPKGKAAPHLLDECDSSERMARIAEVSRALAEQEAAMAARMQGKQLAESHEVVETIGDFDQKPKVVLASEASKETAAVPRITVEDFASPQRAARRAEVSRAPAEQEAATAARPQGNMLAELSGMRDFDGRPKVVPASKGAPKGKAAPHLLDEYDSSERMARIAEVSRALAEQESATAARPQGNMLAELSGMRDFDGRPKVVPSSKGAPKGKPAAPRVLDECDSPKRMAGTELSKGRAAEQGPLERAELEAPVQVDSSGGSRAHGRRELRQRSPLDDRANQKADSPSLTGDFSPVEHDPKARIAFTWPKNWQPCQMGYRRLALGLLVAGCIYMTAVEVAFQLGPEPEWFA